MRLSFVLGILSLIILMLFANFLVFPTKSTTDIKGHTDRELLALSNLRKKIDKGTEEIRKLANQIRQNKGIQIENEGIQTMPTELEEVLVTNSKPHVYGPNAITRDLAPEGIPLLVFTFNRPRELERTLNSIMRNRPANFPLFVTQDGDDAGVSSMIEKYRDDVYHLRFTYKPAGTDGTYYKIAQHYRFALSMMFDTLKYKQVLILEDDMDIAVDFYDYFEALAPILENDPTLYCVSAWNDNGQKQFVRDPEKIYRNDVFPGLGWMMTSKLWAEVGTKWPEGFWDDWLREPNQRQGRNCLYPEINRVYTFGKVGASGGQFYDQFLAPIKLNDQPVAWKTMNFDFLAKETYDRNLRAAINKAIQLQSSNVLESAAKECKEEKCEFVIRYEDLNQLTRIENALGLMSDHKAGTPRASYQGVVPFRYAQHQVYLTPTKF